MTRKIGSRYTVTRVIGRGTCGTVWEGAGPDGPVAVKLLHEALAADQTLIARFVQERTVLTSLVHPNVIAVRDLVVDGTDLALVMDLVRGTDLRERLDAKRALPPADAVALAADVAAGLAAAHARGVVHRDVKPENVLLDSVTGAARLTDFGIARLVDGPRRTRATRIVGTPDYLAPEVIEGCPPGPPVDVYALGTLIFELLTGWTPFGGGHPGAVLRRHVTETVPDVPGMPDPLTDLLTHCLSKAPAARLTAAEVVGRLRVLAPELTGLPALHVADPRAVVDPAALSAGPGPSVPMTVGAVPLVRGAADEADATRQTHHNLMRPIREPLGPSAPIPGAAPAPPRPGPRDVPGPASTGNARNRIPAIAAVLATALVAVGGYAWYHGHRADDGQQPVGAVNNSTTSTTSRPATSPSPAPMLTKPIGPLGLVAFGQVAAPPVKPIGAVHYVRAGDTAYVVMTGTDGVVRYASSTTTDTATSSAKTPPATPHFKPWRTIPGLTASAEPAVVGRASGAVEIYVVSAADSAMYRTIYSTNAQPDTWSPWTPLAPAGADPIRAIGTPAAVALSDNRTQLLVAAKSGSLVSTSGPGTPTGSWQPWRTISSAGPIKPDVALAIRADGTMAAYVVRASDLADLRLVDSGYWSYAFPTGAVGQPEAAYTNSGKPYLFIQSVSGDVQVYEPSGADLHGSMNWAPLGVTSQNPVGVIPQPGLGLVMTTTAPDGTIHLYTSTV